MTTSSRFDFCVLGAGLAGLAISGKLLEHGASVCLIDTNDIASGASGTPLGLVNPATGRFGTKTWRAEKCYEAIASDLKQIQNQTPVRCFRENGILRPAQDAKMAARMKENAESQDWPNGWCTWLDKNVIHSLNPNLNCVEGGLWLPYGLTVDVETYLKSKARILENQGLQIKKNAQYSLSENDKGFRITLKNGDSMYAHSIIYATGYETINNSFWKFLPMHSVKGQVAIFESPEANKFSFSISALGYLATISDSHFVAGSTYEHDFKHTEPDKNGLTYLTKRMSKVYPSLFDNAKLVKQWAGVRASAPNRKPFAGQHPNNENLYILSGFSSKGLLYSMYVGELLTNHIFHQSALPKEISINRIN